MLNNAFKNFIQIYPENNQQGDCHIKKKKKNIYISSMIPFFFFFYRRYYVGSSGHEDDNEDQDELENEGERGHKDNPEIQANGAKETGTSEKKNDNEGLEMKECVPNGE